MREYLLLALVAAAVTYLLVPLVRAFAIRIGAMPEVRDRDVHTTPTPRLGGLAMYGGLVAGLLLATKLDWVAGTLSDTRLANGQTVLALITAGGLITVTGFLDDWWGMDPFIKLGGQIAAAGLLVFFGLSLPWIPLPGSGAISLDETLSTVITILIVVVVINAVNFVDGLDGLAAGIVCIAAMATWAYSVQLSTFMGGSRINATAAITSILIGVCLGFLPHNFHPAKIFMGDTGAMLIGLVLASSMITVTPVDPSAITINRFPLILPVLLPVAVMVLPLLDLYTAVVRRTSHGMSPFAPDRGHLHHRLLDRGHSHRRTVLIMYAWTFVFAFTVVGLSMGGVPVAVFIGTVVLAVAILIVMALPRLRARWASSGAHATSRRGRAAEARRGAEPGSHRRETQPAQPAPRPEPPAQPSAPARESAPSWPVPPDQAHGPDGGRAARGPEPDDMEESTAVMPAFGGHVPPRHTPR